MTGGMDQSGHNAKLRALSPDWERYQFNMSILCLSYSPPYCHMEPAAIPPLATVAPKYTRSTALFLEQTHLMPTHVLSIWPATSPQPECYTGIGSVAVPGCQDTFSCQGGLDPYEDSKRCIPSQPTPIIELSAQSQLFPKGRARDGPVWGAKPEPSLGHLVELVKNPVQQDQRPCQGRPDP
ncbi:hypothetical protein DSO57_1038834 [Entomophthora muscae]|uniref:Uncharacterized protein n=1 Tax=Entomophthora muscae TaxID=34485 RepID=A0ACC2SBG9_9FUNG|nr:hypothetical protein DSO57_1038834 [Entomophthora muscae]